MFAPQSSPAGRIEGQNTRTKDVVFCDRSAFPLAVPSALVASIWDQVNEGLRAVPRGGAEVGGLLLGRHSQTGIVLAEEAVPIQVEYRFGPAFRLSDIDLNGIRTLMASVQKDPSKAVVGFYRSRTRNDSRTQESDSELLAVLEEAHTSFASNFHYYIAFTPLSKLSMTASVSVRKDEGWDDWQHVTLRSNPMSASDPIEFEAAPKAVPTPAPALEQAPARPPVVAPVAHPEPHAYPHQELYTPPQPPVRALAHPEGRSVSPPDWMAALSQTHERPGQGRAANAWYIGGAIVLAAIGLGGYLRFTASQQPRITISEAPAASPATPTVRTGFSAAREGPLWRLTWDRAAVAALNPTGAVLDIRDGGKDQEVGLTPSDLSSGTILYTPQTGDLLFSLNIVMPNNQLAEEHVRVLEALRTADPPSAQDRAEPVKIVVRDQVRTLRPFTQATNGPAARTSIAEMPPPPALSAAAGSPVTSTGPSPIAAMSAPSLPSPTPALSTSGASAAAPVGSGPTSGPKVVRRVTPTISGPMPSGPGSEVQIRVQIDAQGAVTEATPITKNSFVSFRLTEAAQRAARAWVFEPARTGGHPVPSEMILDFRFGPQ